MRRRRDRRHRANAPSAVIAGGGLATSSGRTLFCYRCNERWSAREKEKASMDRSAPVRWLGCLRSAWKVDRRGLAMFGRATMAVVAAITSVGLHSAAIAQNRGDGLLIFVTDPAAVVNSPDRLSPEEKMQRRYPQWVR